MNRSDFAALSDWKGDERSGIEEPAATTLIRNSASNRKEQGARSLRNHFGRKKKGGDIDP
jgi:hypothetical protein